VSRSDEYRKYAAECIGTAQTKVDERIKTDLVTIAMHWLTLADHVDDMAAKYMAAKYEETPARLSRQTGQDFSGLNLDAG
jgi:hypothetical protein